MLCSLSFEVFDKFTKLIDTFVHASELTSLLRSKRLDFNFR